MSLSTTTVQTGVHTAAEIELNIAVGHAVAVTGAVAEAIVIGMLAMELTITATMSRVVRGREVIQAKADTGGWLGGHPETHGAQVGNGEHAVSAAVVCVAAASIRIARGQAARILRCRRGRACTAQVNDIVIVVIIVIICEVAVAVAITDHMVSRAGTAALGRHAPPTQQLVQKVVLILILIAGQVNRLRPTLLGPPI